MPNPKLNSVDGFKVIELYTYADEEKDEGWLARERKKLPQEDFEREILLKPVGRQDAYPVFSDYNKLHHENDKLVYQRSVGLIYRGWDFGKIHPCVEFVQPEGQKINYIYELYGSNIDLVPFAGNVLADSAMLFPGARFVDWGDASGVNTPQSGEGRNCIKILSDLGVHLKYRRQDVEGGLGELTQSLVHWIEGRPRLQINPVKCPHLAEAMRGGYRRNPAGILIKDGKNDHPVDAARYAHQGIVFNIKAAQIRSHVPAKKHQGRPLTDSEQFSKYRQV